LYLLAQGDHVVAGDDLYGGTYRLFDKVLTRYGIEFDFVHSADPARIRAALRSTTRLVWLETPTNPLLKVVDIRAAADAVRAAGSDAWIAVDNTFASPYLQRPLGLGADIVVHSATKYLGGHSDLVGGVVVGNDAAIRERLAFIQNAAGAVPGPFDVWLALRGLKTLALRMERHSANADETARWLADRSDVETVLYPGLPSHPGHQIAARQMTGGFGGMLSFVLSGGAEAARRVVARTKLFTLAESLGGVESLIEVPAAMTHLSVADSPLAVPPGLIRLSVGIEDVGDLIADLDQALAAAG
jgi:cystathionine beta-lyase/cystathionine gamma-synthase